MSRALLEHREPSIAPEVNLLDRLMPHYDATRVERRVIHGSPSKLYDAVLHVDFMDAARRHPAVSILFGMRTLLERAASWLVRRPVVEAPPPPTMRLADMTMHGEWTCLAEEVPHEFVFGAIGRFWAGETRWLTLPASEFAVFHEPGYARIACTLRVTPLTTGHCEVHYEARTQATDPASRRAFLRYWRLVSPFVGIVMRSLLVEVERVARRTAPM